MRFRGQNERQNCVEEDGAQREEPEGQGCVCMREEEGEGGEVGMCVFCVAIVKVCCLFCGTA